jgi:MFS family permease
MLPITIGFLIAGPLSGVLSDRFGARFFATFGLVLVAATFVLLLMIPVDFEYWQFAIITGLSGIGSGMFGAPNRTAIMNSVPANQRGAASGMAGTVQNAGTSLSIGLFFSLLISGLATSLPSTLYTGLTSHGVPSVAAHKIAELPPVGSVFAAFLGKNPIETLLAPTGVLGKLPASDATVLTGKHFFPELIQQPFHDGLVVVFIAAAIMSLIGAIASLSRGKKYLHVDTTPTSLPATAHQHGASNDADLHSAPAHTVVTAADAPAAGAAGPRRQRTGTTDGA